VLMVRETPLNVIHLENMLKLSRIGVIIMPPVPAFYTRHNTVEDIVEHSVGRVLDIFGIEPEHFQRWGEE
jgi:4-hydroxy-3-polyprenylbenzoate decarboxylase